MKKDEEEFWEEIITLETESCEDYPGSVTVNDVPLIDIVCPDLECGTVYLGPAAVTPVICPNCRLLTVPPIDWEVTLITGVVEYFHGVKPRHVG